MSPTHSQRFFSLSELNEMPPPNWLIDGMFEKHSLVMLAGPPGSFKSFLAIDWMMSLVTGRPWNGRTTEPCKVAYLLGEGKSGIMKRAQAWVKYHDPNLDEFNKMERDFKVTFEVPQLASKASVDNMLADLDAQSFKPDVIVIDTFARSFVGMDENDAKDAGLWVEQADRLRQLGYTVIFLHHTKKNQEFGLQYRGSTAIMGAMDTAMTLSKENNLCTLEITKQKEHDEGPKMRFRAVGVSLNNDESCVLIPAPIVDSRFSEEGGTQEPPNSPDVLAAIDALIKDSSYESDRARGRALVSKFPYLVENTAISKVNRRRKELNGEERQEVGVGTGIFETVIRS